MKDPVQHQFEAYNRRDLEAFLEAYHPDVRMEDGSGNLIMKGTDEMRTQYGRLFKDSPDLKCEILGSFSAGEWIVHEEKATGVNMEGSPSEIHAIVAYRVREGLIDFVRMFM